MRNVEQAELAKLVSETKRNDAERLKFDKERAEIESRLSQKWWDLPFTGLIQAAIGGVVAGALIWGFALDHFLKVNELNEKSRSDLRQKADVLAKAKLALEKEQETNRQLITRLKLDNQKIKDEIDNYRQQLAEKLVSKSVDADKVTMQATSIEALEASLADLLSQTQSSDKVLTKQLNALSESQQAQQVSEASTWFPVLASAYKKVDLEGRLSQLRKANPQFPLHVYSTSDGSGSPVYAITFGGYLSNAEAISRVNYAKEAGLSTDAYSWSSTRWGNNIIGQFSQ